MGGSAFLGMIPLFCSASVFSFPHLHLLYRMLEQEGVHDTKYVSYRSVARECEMEEDVVCEM